MKRFAAALALILCTGLAQAEPAATPSPLHIDPALLLPPPPAAGSPQALAEIAELKEIAAATTPQALKAAKDDDRDATPGIFADAVGPGFDLGKLPATAKLLADTIAAEADAAKAAKQVFHRDRPWIVISGWDTCTTHPTGPAANSYPSGHATIGFAMGEMLAALLPDKAPAILARARDFAQNRLVCGYHFRSDVVAGQVLGTTVARELMQDAVFHKEFDAAAAELTAAHLR